MSVVLEGHGVRWTFVADGSGLPAEVVFVTPTGQPPTATPGPPPPTPVPTPTSATPFIPSPSPLKPTALPLVSTLPPLPTVVLMTRTFRPLWESCFPASGWHAWLANLPPWSEGCRGLSASNETIFTGAKQQFAGGWLLWNRQVCFALFADGTWPMF